jgi:2-polyprenyl-3-methyl-5-hydroxy-6-metoxy-1,4-benzoquinol methylase
VDEQHYLIRGGIQGRERLRVLARVMRPTTLPLLERAGVSAGMRCLDVGCGGGDVTFDLASLVGITGSVVGVDLDATKVELAEGDAEQAEVTNVEFRVADLADGLGVDEYDVVYARFVLTHLSDPEAGLAVMLRALRLVAVWWSRTSTTTGRSVTRRRRPRVATTRSTPRQHCATAATRTSGGVCR